MRIASWAVMAVAAFLGSTAQATTVALPTAGNLSDHWWIPEESGWGLSLFQHDDRLLFGVLFVYADSGRAQWFVMPDMRRGEGVAPAFSGALYSTNGSPFGTPFDPASTLVQRRGEATITPLQDGSAQLRYSVDGTTVEKVIRRLSVMGLPIDGTYTVRLAASRSSSCNDESLPDWETWRIRRVLGGYEISRSPPGGTPANARPLQVQQHGSVAIASFAELQSPGLGTWVLVLDSVTGYAMVGKFSLVADSSGDCVIQGSFSGARDFPLLLPGYAGYLSDHWWDPSQSGWGMSVNHGSFGLFAVLFLYSNDARDARGLGLAQWYVIPEMRALPFPGGVEPDPPPPPPGYAGTIYSAQGTPFSQPFNASAIKIVPVGEATFGSFGDNSATLTYRIGDHTVTRQLQRMAIAALQTAGSYRVGMNSFISSCGVRKTVGETWDIELAGDGGHFLSRTDASGAAIGVRVPVQLVQRGKLAQMRFSSVHEGAAFDWTVTLDHAGEGGIGGTYVRVLPDQSCYENGIFAGARLSVVRGQARQ